MKKPNLWKAALTGAALGAVATVVSAGMGYFVARLLTGETLDREEPRILVRAKSRMVTGGKRDLRAEEAVAAAERLKNTPTERVEIKAPDRTLLVGHWQPCPNPKRVIVAMHGWRSAWYKDFGAISDFWLENGCSVLYAEQRGQGESGGEVMSYGFLERGDCYAWVRWVNGHGCAGLPVYLAGISMGATTVLMAAGMPMPPNVRGVMADCGFTSADAIWRHVARNSFHIPYNLWKRQIDRLCVTKTGYVPDAYSTLDALRITKLPVLFIHGLADGFVPPSMTEENYAACAGPKRVLLVPGAGHGMSYLVDRTGYEAAVKNFWTDFDGGVAE